MTSYRILTACITVTPTEMHHQEVRHQTHKLWLKTSQELHHVMVAKFMFMCCMWSCLHQCVCGQVFIWHDSWTHSHHTTLYTRMHIRMPQHLNAMVQSLCHACSSDTVISTLMFGNEATHKFTDGTLVMKWLSPSCHDRACWAWVGAGPWVWCLCLWSSRHPIAVPRASWAHLGSGRGIHCMCPWTPWHHRAVSLCS